MTDTTKSQILDLIQARLKEKGDMPIFSATVNRVHTVSSDPEADAMELSLEILKDASLTAKVLKLANSPLFNRGLGKIANLSRAVVVLGFDTVKSVVLTLKLIDSFQLQHPGIDMSGLLVNAFLSGAFVRRISARCGIKDIEHVYICGLLHNLGEIVIAYALPEYFLRIKELQKKEKLKKEAAEQRVLGTTIRALGQEVAKHWEFPHSVVSSMEAYVTGKGGRIRNEGQLISAMTDLACNTMGLLYDEIPDDSASLAELTYELSQVAGIKKEEVSAALEQSFKESCELAQDYGLNKKHLAPKIREQGLAADDEQLQKLAMQFSFYANSEIGSAKTRVPAAPTKTSDPKAVTPATASAPISKPGATKKVTGEAGDANTLLSVMFELTTLITQKESFTTILDKVLEGMQLGVGFDRVVLCLLSPDHKRYTGRMASGEGADAVMAYMNFPVNTDQDLFSKIIMTGTELRVTNIHDGGWAKQLPADFEKKTGASAFMLGTLRSTARPLGIFYGDKASSGGEISNEDAQSFMQLVAQAQFALKMR